MSEIRTRDSYDVHVQRRELLMHGIHLLDIGDYDGALRVFIDVFHSEETASMLMRLLQLDFSTLTLGRYMVTDERIEIAMKMMSLSENS